MNDKQSPFYEPAVAVTVGRIVSLCHKMINGEDELAALMEGVEFKEKITAQEYVEFIQNLRGLTDVLAGQIRTRLTSPSPLMQ